MLRTRREQVRSSTEGKSTMSSTLLRVLISFTMFAALPAFSQNQASKTSTTTVAKAAPVPPADAASAVNVPISKTVVTIHGLCPDAHTPATSGESKKPGDCVTNLSRQQLETVVKVVEATGRTVLAPQKRDVAMSYVYLMA